MPTLSQSVSLEVLLNDDELFNPDELRGVDYTVDGETEGYREMLMRSAEMGVIRAGDFVLDEAGNLDVESLKAVGSELKSMGRNVEKMEEIAMRAERDGLLSDNDRMEFGICAAAGAFAVTALMPAVALAGDSKTVSGWVDVGVKYGSDVAKSAENVARLEMESFSALSYAATYLLSNGLLFLAAVGVAHYGYVGVRNLSRHMKHKRDADSKLGSREGTVPYLLQEGSDVASQLQDSSNTKLVNDGSNIDTVLTNLSVEIESLEAYSTDVLGKIKSRKLQNSLMALVNHYNEGPLLTDEAISTHSSILRRELTKLRTRPVSVKGLPGKILLPFILLVLSLIGVAGYSQGLAMKANLERDVTEKVGGGVGEAGDSGEEISIENPTIPQPKTEPENAWIFENREIDTTGKIRIITKRDAQGKGIKHTKWMSPGMFNEVVYQHNINVINKKMVPFTSIKVQYERQLNVVRAQLSKQDKEYGDSNTNRDSIMASVKERWENYEDEYRNSKHLPSAKRERDSIVALQRTIPELKELNDCYVYKFDAENPIYEATYDLSTVISKTMSGQPVKADTKKYNGDLRALVTHYEDKIEEITGGIISKGYLGKLDYRLGANREWLKESLAKRNAAARKK
ncbi:hypothetical protein JKY72_06395 [Candidatus Gracilibacteria bacterium]|nr:hypothetical protein [Candidatus Gracilibacteria bacterium]